jgi:hypothetical protein
VLFALANSAAALHKEPAFQASSPKTLSRPSGRLFLLLSRNTPIHTHPDSKNGGEFKKLCGTLRAGSALDCPKNGAIT